MNEITDLEFTKLRDYIKLNFGINLSDEKKFLVYSRLKTILQEMNMESFTEYYNFLINDKSRKAIPAFIDKITTNHTYFMRETSHFDYLKDTILPRIEEEHGKSKDLRIWCAGSSSGEEPYTLMMIINDYFKNKPQKWDITMLATDISTTVLDKATLGVYSKDSVNTLPEKWQKEYFKPHSPDKLIVVDEIKKQIIYRKFNLMDEFPFKKPFQVIFCRNVMIYFDSETRAKLVNKFFDVLGSGGNLLIGHSESLSNIGTNFKYVKPAIYRKM